ncbi:uncharacterized protein LOC131029584 isoform X2 [Cryptomeria japonica]|uniref:uncharacterized protein LOC131029584 isoform X2 n=1 Tax=Cryptomeria japonica TaxID=3369 RepID=UPI0027DA2978|nr:uncharacterized protein LOC131029584 isoform X2 [Cryptomeria japonica]
MEVVHLGRTCPHYRGSFSTLAAFKRLNESVRVRVKSYANVERAMCEVHSVIHFNWNTQTLNQLPISKKRDFIIGYKQEHHSSPSHQEEEEEEDDDDDDDVDEDWPVDEDIDERWRVSASDYFKEPRIRNVVAEDGTVIDWEGDSNRGIIQEISCMEWERTVFHPSPLIVLLFERYARYQDGDSKARRIYKSAGSHQGRSSKDKDDLLRSSLALTRTAFFGLTSSRATSPIQYSKARYINHPAHQGHKKLEQGFVEEADSTR